MQTITEKVKATPVQELSLDELESLIMDDVIVEEDDHIESVEFAPVVESNDDEIDEFLSSLDAVEPTEEEHEVNEEEMLESVVREIEVKESKAAAYKSQPAQQEATQAPKESVGEAMTMKDRLNKALDKALEAKKAIKEAKPPRAEKPKKEPTKTSHTHSREDLIADRASSDFYLLSKSDIGLSDDEKSKKHEAVVEMIKKMNVKVGAKCLNLLSAANGRAELSVFMKLALDFAKKSDGFKSSDLVNFFVDEKLNGSKSYNKSTAMPQTTNCIRVFVDLGILINESSTYHLNKDSLLLEKLGVKIDG